MTEKSSAIESPLLGMHTAAGAVIGEFFGTRLPARFGEFSGEYRAARESVALVDASYFCAFSFTGPDRARYLNAVLTSNVRDLPPGSGAIGLLLTPQGHILAEVQTYALADRILAVSHFMARERTLATLEKFIIMDDVTLEDVTDKTAALALTGPRTAAVIAELAGLDLGAMPAWSHAEAALGGIPCRAIGHSNSANWMGQPGATLLVATETLPDAWAFLEREVRARGGSAAGYEAINSIRLESGVAWFGADFDGQQIPHEAGLEHSHISYEKGCYTGQEIVERVRSRGHVNRRLAGLAFALPDPPRAGASLLLNGAEVGQVTSAAFSPRLGRPIGLGYLRREHSAPGTTLGCAGGTAEVISPLGARPA